MAIFIGWCPTILGRIAFSRIGDHCTPGSVIANESTNQLFIFGVTRRISHDGPIPAWLTARLGRFPYTDWALFLTVQPGKLPFEKDACTDARDAGPDVVMRDDERAELAGRMFLLNGATGELGAGAAGAMATVRDEAHLAMGGRTPDKVKANSFHAAKEHVEKAWLDLMAANRRGMPTPISGIVDVVMSRSGMVTLEVRAENSLTTRAIKEAHASGVNLDEGSPSVRIELERIANQAFFALRDLTHQHYHHKKRSDLLTTVTPLSIDNDEIWRRETQYGLTRMAIAVRRQGRAESYRQALGIVAYAEAFQRHFCGWNIGHDGQVQKSAISFRYDFAALRASIEASLKVRELKDANRRARMFFAFGTAITALSVVVPAYRGDSDRELPFWADLFRDGLNWLVDHPIPFLLGAALVGWIVDQLFLGLALNPDWFERARASASRLAGGFMGMLRRHRATARVAQLLTLSLILLVIAASVLATYYAYSLTFSLIGTAAGQ